MRERGHRSGRLTGTDRQRRERVWAARGETGDSTLGEPARSTDIGASTTGTRILYDKESILAFAGGKPSEAFGAPYRVFDEGDRRIARLPRPPYQFLRRT